MTNQRIRVFLCIGDRFDIARAARGLPKVRDGHADAREQAGALRCQLVAKRHEEAHGIVRRTGIEDAVAVSFGPGFGVGNEDAPDAEAHKKRVDEESADARRRAQI